MRFEPSYDYEEFFFRFGGNFPKSNFNPVWDSLEELDNRNTAIGPLAGMEPADLRYQISKDHAQGLNGQKQNWTKYHTSSTLGCQ
jgi:hypothetical protein